MPPLMEKIRESVRNFPDEKTEEIPGEYDDVFPDEFLTTEAPQDPPPQRLKAIRKSKPRANTRLRKQIRDELEALLMLVSTMISVRDTHCGPVINAQAGEMADALAEIIARNPAVAAWFQSGRVLMDWVKVWTAVAPVVMAIAAHHITHTVGNDDDESAASPSNLVTGAFPPYQPPFTG